MIAFRFLLALLILTTTTLRAEDTHEVRLHRAVKKGDKFRIAAKVAVDSVLTTTRGADDVDEVKTKAASKLLGELTVVAVTPKGLVKELRLKLSEAECMEDEATSDFFKKGDVIHMRKEDGETVTTVNGEEPEGVQSETLDAFLHVQADGEGTDDELYGTKEKVKVGDEWAINSEGIVEDWTEEGFEGLKAEHIKGTSRLAGVGLLDGKPSLRLSGTFKMDARDLTLPSLPEGVKATRFKMEGEDEVEVPVDVTAMASKAKMSIRIELDAAGTVEDDGEKVAIKIKSRQRLASETAETPIP